LQDVQAHAVALGIEQSEGYEIKRYERFEKPAEVFEECGELVLDRYRLGDFEQRFIPLASRIGSNRGRRGHGNGGWASLQPYHRAIPHKSRPPGLESAG